MTRKNDQQLLDMFARPQYWTPYQLDAARAELQRRSVVVPNVATLPTIRLPEPKADPHLQGIDGWLALVALGLVVGPLHVLYCLWRDLGLLSGPAYEAFRPTAVYELLVNAAFLACLVYLNMLFWSKKKTFPKYCIVFLGAHFILILIDYGICPKPSIFEGYGVVNFELMQTLQTLKDNLAEAFISGVILASYLMNSWRVGATFVR